VPSWFRDHVVDTGRLPLFLCFLAFVVTFLATRVITRMIRAGRGPFRDNVASSGLHVHHAVPGVVLLISGAFLSVGAGGEPGWAEVAGVVVGVGTSLVLDEFALILRLDDVYWSEEGRISVELVGLTIACLGLILIGLNPFRVDGSADAGAVVASIGTIAVNLVFVAVTALKGKYPTALVGAFVPMVAWIGAVRLARPSSRWATRRYDERRLDRARTRAERFDARYGAIGRHIADFVAGPPVVRTPQP
jgi:hypothetical protein